MVEGVEGEGEKGERGRRWREGDGGESVSPRSNADCGHNRGPGLGSQHKQRGRTRMDAGARRRFRER